jgi:hypothetical protein
MKPKPEYIKGLFVREKHIKTQGGEFDFISVVVDVESFAQEVKEHAKIGKIGKKELKMKFLRRREESGTGITHSVVLDTWEPNQNMSPKSDSGTSSQPAREAATPSNQNVPCGDDEVPF